MKLAVEEDVKLKIVFGFLKSLGFQEDELQFESSFFLNIGRYTYQVDTGKQCQRSEPRLDILVTRNNINLFVVEVKNELVKISQDEIDQAISYARLVHPIAPFAIVTNGKEFHIYDSITKQELKKDQFRLAKRYDVVLSEELRYEALRHFIGYSKDNVIAFCQKQVLEGMRTLLGSKDNRYRKYIPELYSPRKELGNTFSDFLISKDSVFALVGDSGTGKTCSLCALSQELMNKGYPVLFYRARDLVYGITKSIADDFNWEFTSEYSEIQVFKRIIDLFDKSICIIFLDAADEWMLPHKVEIIGNFLRQTHGKNIKVVLSCKTSVWGNFLNQGGTPTYLSEFLYKTQDKEQGYLLHPMTGEEFHKALDNYRRFYSFDGRFEDNVLEESKKNPFLLRILFEVAHNLGLKDLTFSSSIEIFKLYYTQTLEKIGERQIADASLKAVAKSLLDRDIEAIELDVIRQDLGLRVNETLVAGLFDYDVLDMIGEQLNGKVTFYFEKIRDYLVSYHVIKFQELSLQEFGTSIEHYKSNKIYQQALKFYYPFATPEKQLVIDSDIRQNAETYLSLYVEILENHFPNFKKSFSPCTQGQIGFIGEFSIGDGKLGLYGFRPLDEVNYQRIQFIPVDTIKFFGKHSNLSYLHGATSLHYSASSGGVKNIDVKTEVLEHEVKPQLKQIIEKGMLNEKNNSYLLLEKTIAIIAHYQKNHHGIKDIKKMSQYLPIKFDTIEYALRYEKAARIYHDGLIEKKRKSGELKETWNGSIVSYSYTLSNVDKEWIHNKSAEAAKRQVLLKSNAMYRGLDEAEIALEEALFCLREQGLDAITELIMPDIDNECTKWSWDLYSYETLKRYIKRIYLLFLNEYSILVETNFASLKDHFNLYKRMPIICFIIIEKNQDSEDYQIYIYQCKNETSMANEVILCNRNELEYNYNTGRLTYSGHTYECFSEVLTGSLHFLTAYRKYVDFPISDNLLILRYLVYNQILEELNTVINHLFKLYGYERQIM